MDPVSLVPGREASAPPSPPPDLRRALIRRIIQAGPLLPDDLRAEVLALDRSVSIPILLELLECDGLSDETAPGQGYAPISAVALLRELSAAEAIEPMLRVLEQHDPRSILHHESIVALQALGGTLTPDQQQRLARAGAVPDEKAAQAMDAAANAAVWERVQLIDEFDVSAQVHGVRTLDWVELMLRYSTDLGVPFAALDGKTLEEIVFTLFPRRALCEPSVAGDVVHSLRAFWTFARDERSHPHAEECLALLGEGAAARLERELSDPANFGQAKSLVMSVGGPEFLEHLDDPDPTPALPMAGSPPASSRAGKDVNKEKKRLRKQREKARRRNRR